MPAEFQYKLMYFPIRGLAESIRLLFADNEINFIDEKITRGDWDKSPEIKAKMVNICGFFLKKYVQCI